MGSAASAERPMRLPAAMPAGKTRACRRVRLVGMNNSPYHSCDAFGFRHMGGTAKPRTPSSKQTVCHNSGNLNGARVMAGRPFVWQFAEGPPARLGAVARMLLRKTRRASLSADAGRRRHNPRESNWQTSLIVCAAALEMRAVREFLVDNGGSYTSK